MTALLTFLKDNPNIAIWVQAIGTVSAVLATSMFYIFDRLSSKKSNRRKQAESISASLMKANLIILNNGSDSSVYEVEVYYCNPKTNKLLNSFFECARVMSLPPGRYRLGMPPKFPGDKLSMHAALSVCVRFKDSSGKRWQVLPSGQLVRLSRKDNNPDVAIPLNVWSDLLLISERTGQ